MIEVQHLCKQFPHRTKDGRSGFKTAVDDLTLSVGRGRRFCGTWSKMTRVGTPSSRSTSMRFPICSTTP